MPDPSSPPAGWFPDPLDRYEHRYFNGTSWTSDVGLAGERFVDPLGTGSGPAAASTSNTAATASVVMGSVGLAIAWIPFIVVAGLVLAILALVFGIRGLRRARTTGVGRGASIAGTVMGGLGVGLSAVGVVLSVMVWNEVIAFVEPGPVSTEVIDCAADGRRAQVAGTVTNLDDQEHDYTLFVEVGGTTEVVVVEAVAADETATWTTEIIARSAVTECEADVVVQGPFPYGIEVDPVN